MTSPPYWTLKDYTSGNGDQMGNYLPLPFGPCASSGIVMIQSFR